MLRIKNLSKSFGEKDVLKDFSHDFAADSITLITGQSGVGKTTLLRIIAGLETADSGCAQFSNGTVISYMFQEPRLLPWMSVHDNVSAVLDKPDKESVHTILTELGLGGDTSTMPHELSGGMQRRVSLARTLLFPADIYLFDEPFAGLDSKTAKVAANVIREYATGKTVIIVSHDSSMLDSDIDVISL